MSKTICNRTGKFILFSVVALILVFAGTPEELVIHSQALALAREKSEVSDDGESEAISSTEDSPADTELTLGRCDPHSALIALNDTPERCSAWFKSCPNGEELWWDAHRNANGCHVRYGTIWRLAELAPSDKLVDHIASILKSGEDAIESTPELREIVFFARIDSIASLGVISSEKSTALLAHMFTPAGEKEYTDKWIDLEVEGYLPSDGVPTRMTFLPEFRGKVAEGLIMTNRMECRRQVEEVYEAVNKEYEQIPDWLPGQTHTWEERVSVSTLGKTVDALAYALALGDAIDEMGREEVIRANPFPGGDLAQKVEKYRDKY